MADTAVDTTATAEVTAKVGFHSGLHLFFFFLVHALTVVLKRFPELFKNDFKVVLFVLRVVLTSWASLSFCYTTVGVNVTVNINVTSCKLWGKKRKGNYLNDCRVEIPLVDNHSVLICNFHRRGTNVVSGNSTVCDVVS